MAGSVTVRAFWRVVHAMSDTHKKAGAYTRPLLSST